jgi:hypothetical protein
MFLLPAHATLPLFGNDPSVALGGNLLTNSDITSSSATLHFSPNGIFVLGVGGSSGESTSGHSVSGYGASIGFFPTTLSDDKIPIIIGLEFGISIFSSGSTSIYGKSGGLIIGGFAEFEMFSIQPELVFAATSITAADNTGVWTSSPTTGSILMSVPFAFEMGKNSFLLIGPAVGIADGTPVYGASVELNFKMD